MYKHVCGCNEYFSGNVDLCHKHILNRFNTESIHDVIKIVLKPINFHNYHNKFVLEYCCKVRYTDHISTNVSVISIDGTVTINIKLLNNNDVISGCIVSNEFNGYQIHNNTLIWSYFPHQEGMPNLDPIKKHLRNLAIPT